MKRPILFCIDDDPQVLRAVGRDLKAAYRKEYKILSTDNPQEGLDALVELRKKNEVVALFLVDQRMPSMLGVEFLRKAMTYYPDAKRVLLTAYSDTDAAIRAINEVQLDYYLTKPWDPPEEKLLPVLTDLLTAWQLTYRPDFDGIKVIGYQYSPLSHEIKDFLASNLFPYEWLDAKTSVKAQELLAIHNVDRKALPVVSFPTGECMSQPSIGALAERLGFESQAKETLYDVVIIGGGPSGLAASVYAGSEGLKALLIEKRAPGGQAGSSSRIENYLGFPNGVSGQELSHRAVTQAKRFGIEILSPKEVVGLETVGDYKAVILSDGQRISCRSVVISTGVAYRRLPAKGVNDLTGAGIYYGSSMSEAQACCNQKVYIVGGGNSAGQAAVYLSTFAEEVNIVIRKPNLTSSMSSYLIDQIDAINNINLIPRTTIVEAMGDTNRLCGLVLENNQDKSCRSVEAAALFIFIGSRPYTDWLSTVIKDERGFIETGRDLAKYDQFSAVWKRRREPFLLESCIPGVFVAGDVRAGAMNRVASAVGEGSMAIKFVHEYLAEV